MEGRAGGRQDMGAGGGLGAAELGKLFTRKGNTQMKKKGAQTEFQKQKNETRPPRMFSLGPPGLLQTV